MVEAPSNVLNFDVDEGCLTNHIFLSLYFTVVNVCED